MKTIRARLIEIAPRSILRILRLFREFTDRVKGFIWLALSWPNSYHPYTAKYFPGRIKKGTLRSTNLYQEWGAAFIEYGQQGSARKAVPLMWADTPAPGNFGDWLSPYIFSRILDRPVSHISPAARPRRPHLIGLGSIIGNTSPSSIVIGAGAESSRTQMDPRGQYHSVRGPYTAEILRKLGGPRIDRFGDPAFLLPQILPMKPPNERNYPINLVRHINHRQVQLEADLQIVETGIFASTSRTLEQFVREMLRSEIVVTSAMHCMIICISYGVPCVLFRPKVDQAPVPGDGMKYRDALAGVGLPEISPAIIDLTGNLLAQIRDLEPYSARLTPEMTARLQKNFERNQILSYLGASEAKIFGA